MINNISIQIVNWIWASFMKVIYEFLLFESELPWMLVSGAATAQASFLYYVQMEFNRMKINVDKR